MGVRNSNLKLKNLSLAGALIFLGVGGIWFGVDRAINYVYRLYRLDIEREISKKIGYSLILGPYKGLRLWGVSIGSSKLIPSAENLSSAELDGLKVGLAPISSILRLRPVASLQPFGTKILLVKNSQGKYWNGRTEKKAPSPKLDFRLIVKDPVRVHLENEALEFLVKSQASIQIYEKKIYGSAQVSFPDRGILSIRGGGSWDVLDFYGRSKFYRLDLNNLNGFWGLGTSPFTTKGTIDGDIQVSVREGKIDCRGNMNLKDFYLEGGILKDKLSSQSTTILCKDKILDIRNSKWRYGPIVATLNANLPLENNYNLDFNTYIGFNESSMSRMNLQGALPFDFNSNGLELGELNSKVILENFPLSKLGRYIDTSLSGFLSIEGNIKGKLQSLSSKLDITLLNPQIRGLRLQEEWKGKFIAELNKGARLQMNSVGAAVPGSLSTVFLSDWSLDNFIIKRLGGKISVNRDYKKIGETSNYFWEANSFRLDRVEVLSPGVKGFKRVFGELEGNGKFHINPFKFEGLLDLRYARFMGLRLKEAKLNGTYLDRGYSIIGKLLPFDKGRIEFKVDGSLDGDLLSKVKVEGLSASWIAKTAIQVQKINLNLPKTTLGSGNFGGFLVKSISNSLDESLQALSNAQLALRRNYLKNRRRNFINPDDLEGVIDADISFKGSSLSELVLDLDASGTISTNKNINASFDNNKKFRALFKGPLKGGLSEFSIINIPLDIFSLIAPFPSSIRGSFGISGSAQLGSQSPEIKADLTLNDAILDEEKFFLERGNFFFTDMSLDIDIALRSESSIEPLTLVGNIPFKSTQPIDIRVESHGDGLRFLDGIFDDYVSWEAGTADLRLWVRGNLNDPEANGFLVLKDGQFVVMDKLIKNVEGSVLFDFNLLDIQNLKANIGRSGTINSSGAISLFKQSANDKETLSLEMNKVPLKFNSSEIEVASNLIINGSLLNPRLGGNISIQEGFISPGRPGVLNSKKSVRRNKETVRNDSYLPPKVIPYPEEKWNRVNDLVLFVQDSASPASKMLKGAIPKLSSVLFQDLRLRLGPNLRIASQPLANFNISGLLTLNGAFDETLQPQGLVRLTQGRVNLFTTTFDLDRREPNVAIFTPSMGLIPYVDVKLTSRVPDTVRDEANLASSSDFATNGAGAFGIGGSRFINVEVIASGPVDRISENFQLRSTPPMPRNQLLGLIGGNSLTRLLGGGEKEILANVLSRSLISPVLGNITGAFNNRLQISLYPAYIASPKTLEETDNSPSGSSPESKESSGSLLPQQAWVTEMGVDLNKRFNFSLQATPNRKDIPPQGTLTYQFNGNLGLLGSVDNEGTWKSQVQYFLRF